MPERRHASGGGGQDLAGGTAAGVQTGTVGAGWDHLSWALAHQLVVPCCPWWADHHTGSHVNTKIAESIFAFIKRGHYGLSHSMNKPDLHRYGVEFEFHWKHWKGTDHTLMDVAISGIGGKRMVYEPPAWQDDRLIPPIGHSVRLSIFFRLCLTQTSYR